MYGKLESRTDYSSSGVCEQRIFSHRQWLKYGIIAQMLAQIASILLTFPGENARLPSVTNTYCIGAVPTNVVASLVLNGATTDVYRTGAYLAMIPVTNGVNRIVAEWNGETLVRTFTVEPPPKPSATPAPPSKPRNPFADLGIPTNTVCKPPPFGRRPEDVFILIDPGHGGRDTGARSPHGWCEKDVNLAQALAVRDALAKAGFRTALTRSDDSFPALYDRPKQAIRDGADAFISVHHNSTHCSRNPRISRHTTAYASNEPGLALASAIQKHVASAMSPVKDCGAQMRSFAVCRNPAVPSCLLEIDFINLPEGEEESWNSERQKKVATAVALGVLDWMMPHKTSDAKE